MPPLGVKETRREVAHVHVVPDVGKDRLRASWPLQTCGRAIHRRVCRRTRSRGHEPSVTNDCFRCFANAACPEARATVIVRAPQRQWSVIAASRRRASIQLTLTPGTVVGVAISGLDEPMQA